jgi:taurine dioxygenase
VRQLNTAPDTVTGATVRPLTAGLGALVEGLDARKPLAGSTAAWLRQALLDHQVLFAHDQDLSDDEHIAFASTFGTPNVYPVTAARGIDQPLEWIEDDGASPPKADIWHTDAAFMPDPPDVAVLNMRDTPPVGGDTLWLDLYGAYQGLSPVLQGFVDGLTQDVHPGPFFKEKIEVQFGPGIYEKVAADFSGWRHPVVRVHPGTGRKALYLCGAYVKGITGMAPEESDVLYALLRQRLTDPAIQCRWSWQPFDLAVWDERCTNHRALGDHYPQHRLVRRCTVGTGRPAGPGEISAAAQ